MKVSITNMHFNFISKSTLLETETSEYCVCVCVCVFDYKYIYLFSDIYDIHAYRYHWILKSMFYTMVFAESYKFTGKNIWCSSFNPRENNFTILHTKDVFTVNTSYFIILTCTGVRLLGTPNSRRLIYL